MCPGLACYQTAIIHRTDRPAVLSGRIGFGCGPGRALSRAHSDKLDLDTWTCTKREFTVEGHVGQYYGVFSIVQPLLPGNCIKILVLRDSM